MYGFGVEKDLEKAHLHFHEAADVGNANAQFKLCTHYHHNNDLEKSRHYFNLLSDEYHPQHIDRFNERYRNISYCYAHGIGVACDPRKAADYKELEE